MLGKVITLHQDGVAHAVLLYRPEVTDELTLSVSWLRQNVAIELTEGELLILAAKLTKAVKKVQKHKRKLAKRRHDPVKEFVLKGRR